MKHLFTIILLLMICRVNSFAQHEHHITRDTAMAGMNMNDTTPVKDQMEMGDMDMRDDEMSHSFSRNLPMNRNGSGTGWLPDASPMYGYMFHSKKWMYMLHGSLFLRYNKQDLFDR